MGIPWDIPYEIRSLMRNAIGYPPHLVREQRLSVAHVGEWVRNWGVDMAPELRIFGDGSTFEFVSPIDMAWQLGIKPPCPSCRRVDPSTKCTWWLDAKMPCHIDWWHKLKCRSVQFWSHATWSGTDRNWNWRKSGFGYKIWTSDLLYQIRLVARVWTRCSRPQPSIIFDQKLRKMFENLDFGPEITYIKVRDSPL